MKQLYFLMAAFLCVISTAGQVSAASIDDTPQPRKLAVLLNYGTGTPQITAEDLV